MQRKMILSYIFVMFVGTLVMGLFSHYTTQQHYLAEIDNKLISIGKFVSLEIENKHSNSVDQNLLNNIAVNYGEFTNTRITFVDFDGEVVGDSDADYRQLENHSDRPEIKDAIKNGIGRSIRYSTTLKQHLRYLALRIDESGSSFVMRISIPADQINIIKQDIVINILYGMIIAILISMILGVKFANKLINPLKQLTTFSKEIAKGNFDAEISIQSKDEIKELTVSFIAMKNQLFSDITNIKKLEQIRSDFVSNVSHELKTPLTSIRGFIDTLKNGAIEDTQVAEHFLDIIDIEAERLTILISDILALSEIENMKKDVRISEYNLSDIMDEVMMIVLHGAMKKKVQLKCTIEPSDTRVHINRDRLKQMLINLIDNAIKYNNEEGVVEIICERRNQVIEFRIKDNGIGIPVEHLPRLFERFYRIDKGRSRLQGGTGLGLSIVKHIVNLYNGEVRVKSEYGKGTEFIIYLPIVL